MKMIEVKSNKDVPKRFTGIVKYNTGFSIIKLWYKNGSIHRKNGPAIIYPDGTKWWWVNGKSHRENGPSYIAANIKEWYLNNIKLTEEQHKIIMMLTKESRKKLYKNKNYGLKNFLGINDDIS